MTHDMGADVKLLRTVVRMTPIGRFVQPTSVDELP
jgi:lipopolysaccharide/colanic/teichoic acid biosynthesis glycosyltransferase